MSKEKGSKEAMLARIEEALVRVESRQDEISKRLGRLEAGGAAGSAPVGEAETRGFLDQFRAGEALGEASLGAWIEVVRCPALKGSLRVIQHREGFHARLLEARIKELGGSVKAEIPEAIFEASMSRSGSKEKSDGEKLAAFMAQFPDCDAALQPIYDMAAKLDHDPETQALLVTIAQDERSTLECLAQHCERLNA